MEQLFGLLPFIVMMVVFYLVLFLPERKRKKQYQSMLDSLSVNDEVMTRGGIIGRIINLQDEFIILETGPERVRIKVQRKGISSVSKSSQIAE
ncbi:preprotein translocase subunit YajC [Clostridium grantii]|uniref:Preprotein translocase subunit YajC n=1 Tax=Clostridium grantii DSM 8605 TaxID=1121316 RepID=A0A1M5SJN3_9CLOT|nr:preprotein translocase subunit YajC [Clostridium grantii]SHH38802.1 preprotein translocase subunit YajC [Clostridium grantii DSM 8605]